MELRLYTFINYYLSSIQQGVQSAHLVHELFNKYGKKFIDIKLPDVKSLNRPGMSGPVGIVGNSLKPESERLWDWSENHKTMIVLNGGNAEDIKEKHLFLSLEHLSFPAPWVSFREDDKSLSGTMTGVCVVLPDFIYDAKTRDQVSFATCSLPEYDHRYFSVDESGIITKRIEFDSPDGSLITMLKSCSLAR